MRPPARPILALAAVVVIAVGAYVVSTSIRPVATPPPTATQAAVASPPMPAVAGRVRAVTAADKIPYPSQKVAITLTSGYASHGNNMQVTSGLSNVPVGTDVFLEGISKDETGAKVTSWKWTLEPPAFSAAKLDVSDPQHPRFNADRVGRYSIVVTATNEKGVATKSTIVVNAGVYAGEALCATCHNGSVQPDIVGQWEETNHARHMDLAYASYSATSDYCIQCHTTGYNEADTARGFDDRAKAAGWDPTKGSLAAYLTGQKATLNSVLASSEGVLANIQCEACHGPGGSSHTAVKSFETGVCAQCHSAQPAQWATSGHVNSGRNTLEEASNPSCAVCHTGQGFVEGVVRGNALVYPNTATADKPANMVVPTDQAPIACATCHDPHQATDPGEPTAGHSLQLRMTGDVKMPNGTTVDAGTGAVCVSCHADKRTVQYMQQFVDGKQTRGAHDDTQADVLYGTGVFTYGESFRNSPHLKAGDACVTCHQADNPTMNGTPGSHGALIANSVGGHSWNMKGTYTGLANGKQVTDLEVYNLNGCNSKGCHAGAPLTSFDVKADGDYDGNGSVGTWQDEVKGLLTALGDKLPKDAKGAVISSGITDQNTTKEQRQALWNYWVVQSDGSSGLHNIDFSIQLLQSTYKHLVGSDVPNAKIMR
ncbi:MAG: hypothetical protein KGN00_03865 [Chloroflexota bacterium]|nr:hypothetical protein [Chloroflexota bacterium]